MKRDWRLLMSAFLFLTSLALGYRYAYAVMQRVEAGSYFPGYPEVRWGLGFLGVFVAGMLVLIFSWFKPNK